MHRIPILCFVALLFVPNGAWAQGEPIGPEFQVNTSTTNDQDRPAVASDSSGNFVVVWAAAGVVLGQRYASSGVPLGPESAKPRGRGAPPPPSRCRCVVADGQPSS
jgi:hypothetical protein